ncbi:S-layer homology domain-containing protein [Microaerobacter geothermalis]|uniref:S-layer homology domain-containing protein n=1 Tax=Microaerobacter geothermalis TaxID=674972 RepID=UPI001F37BA1C|nr:S-layer homology domain-containing protein [Microaerobacter geothermalis]MCF6093288.1 S-layer homology domain-containing protein [Microaerobacter geothermalis]
MSKCTRKWISFVITLFMLITLVPASIEAAPRTSFPDVAENYWGAKDIAKAGLLEIIQGDDKGMFAPEQPVTQLQAIIMAIRAKGLQDKVNQLTDTSSFYLPEPEGKPYPAWAKAYVVVAYQHGLIKYEENRFKWDQPASRAWVSQLMVRTAGKDSDVTGASGETLTFTDRASIPSWAIRYVEVAVNLGLVTGYNDGTFQPNKAVKRVEMAALISRVLPYTNLSGWHQGTILEVGTTDILVNENGETKRYSINLSTIVYDGKTKGTPSQLTKNRAAQFITDTYGSVKFIEMGEIQAPPVTRTKGTVISFYQSQNLLVIKNKDNQLVTLEITPNVRLLGPSSVVPSLSDIQTGVELEVTLNSEGKVTEILLSSVSTRGSVEGTVAILDLQNNIMTLNTIGGLKTYLLSSTTTVDYQGIRFATVRDIQVGDKVKLDVENNAVTKVTLIQMKQQAELKGSIVQLTPESNILTLRGETGKLQAYEVSPDAEIIIQGLNQPALKDVKVGDEVSVSITEGKISRIEVLGRTVISALTGKVINVDTRNLVINLRNDANKLLAYEIDPNVEVRIDGVSSPDLTDLSTDQRVQISLDDNKVTYIEVINTVEGKVVDITDRRREITIYDSLTGKNVTYTYISDVDVDAIDISSPDIDDVDDGDEVVLHFDSSQRVDEIWVKRSIIRTLDEINTSRERIKVEDEDGNSKTYYYDKRDTQLTIEGIANPSWSDLKAGDILRLQFTGNDLIAVAQYPLEVGQITQVSLYNKSITVGLYNGTTKSYTITDKDTIWLTAENKTGSFASFAVGDRIQILPNSDGSLKYIKAEKKSTKIAYVDPSNWRLFEDVTYRFINLSKKVFIQKAGTEKGLSEVTGKNVNLYYINDLVIEVEILN